MLGVPRIDVSINGDLGQRESLSVPRTDGERCVKRFNCEVANAPGVCPLNKSCRDAARGSPANEMPVIGGPSPGPLSMHESINRPINNYRAHPGPVATPACRRRRRRRAVIVSGTPRSPLPYYRPVHLQTRPCPLLSPVRARKCRLAPLYRSPGKGSATRAYRASARAKDSPINPVKNSRGTCRRYQRRRYICTGKKPHLI